MGYEDQLREIENDNSSGASEIVMQANQCLLSFSEEFESNSKKEFFKEMVKVGKRLIQAQPEMAPLFNYVNGVLFALEDSVDIVSDVKEQKRSVKTYSNGFFLQSKMAQMNIQKLVLLLQNMIK